MEPSREIAQEITKDAKSRSGPHSEDHPSHWQEWGSPSGESGNQKHLEGHAPHGGGRHTVDREERKIHH